MASRSAGVRDPIGDTPWRVPERSRDDEGMAELLNDEQIDTALEGLPEWQREGDAFVRTVELPGFSYAIAVVNRVAEVAESVNHHPDIDIRYNKLTFSLSTHYKGGLTELDPRMAGEIDRVVETMKG